MRQESLKYVGKGEPANGRLLACYAPDRIPLHLLSEANAETLDQLDPTAHPPLATLAADPLRLDQAVAALQRYLRPRAWRHRCSTGRDSS